MLSDAFKVVEVDDVAYEVDCKVIKKSIHLSLMHKKRIHTKNTLFFYSLLVLSKQDLFFVNGVKKKKKKKKISQW